MNSVEFEQVHPLHYIPLILFSSQPLFKKFSVGFIMLSSEFLKAAHTKPGDKFAPRNLYMMGNLITTALWILPYSQ
jgi:hypothetical protein